ncbi:hypothetical protein MYX84_12080, partial [Acidobacteria bacterium AH-259-O06]|nr:hypothetical protein [Acidobacteria bacterium AH-259-O06]
IANLEKAREEYEKTKRSQELQIKDLELQLEEACFQQEKSQNKLIQAKQFESNIKVQETEYEAKLDRKRLEILEKKLESVRRKTELQLRILKDTENLHEHRVEIGQKALEALTIKAPISGVVICQTNWRNEKKQVGSQVHRLEKVISLPDLTTLVVNGQVASSMPLGSKSASRLW